MYMPVRTGGCCMGLVCTGTADKTGKPLAITFWPEKRITDTRTMKLENPGRFSQVTHSGTRTDTMLVIAWEVRTWGILCGARISYRTHPQIATTAHRVHNRTTLRQDAHGIRAVAAPRTVSRPYTPMRRNNTHCCMPFIHYAVCLLYTLLYGRAWPQCIENAALVHASWQVDVQSTRNSGIKSPRLKALYFASPIPNALLTLSRK